jgi:chromosome segregation ATPase
LEASKVAKNHAATVAQDIDKVVTALEKAENSSMKAKDAADAASHDITMAEEKITSIKTLITQIEGTMSGITDRLDAFDARLKAVGRVTGDNILSLANAEQNAMESKTIAQGAVDTISQSDTAIESIEAVIADRSAKNERIVNLRKSVDDFVSTVNDDYTKLVDYDQKYQDYEAKLTDKSGRLQDLLEEMKILHEQITQNELITRTCQ